MNDGDRGAAHVCGPSGQAARHFRVRSVRFETTTSL